MERYYYIELDIHKRIIAYCVKTIDGHLIEQWKIGADRQSPRAWVKGLPGPLDRCYGGDYDSQSPF